MPLSNALCEALSRQFGLDHNPIQADDEGLSITGELLPSPGLTDFRTFLDEFTVANQTDDVVQLISGSKTVTLQRVVLRANTEAGLVEVEPGASWLFLGSFGTNTEAIDISACPELILALATLPPIKPNNAMKNWSSIIESWGPLAISYGKPPEAALAEIGCFCARQSISAVQFQPPSGLRGFTARTATSDEEVQAYISALEAQDGPDVTIHRLYRIFELKFAQSVKDDISNTPLSQVWKKLKDLKLSELKALETTVASSPMQFQRFSSTDFDNLFGAGHLPPEGGQYGLLRNWLNRRTTLYPVNGCRAHIIYYVRNALVHSKVSDGDTFLMGPYEGVRAVALVNLAQDIHDLVRDIIAV